MAVVCVADALSLVYEWLRRVRGPAAKQASTTVAQAQFSRQLAIINITCVKCCVTKSVNGRIVWARKHMRGVVLQRSLARL